MKKLCAVMTSCVMVLSLSTPLFAADETNVWLDANEFVVEESNVTANVYSDGTNTDGQLVITYNADELSLTEEDIVVSECIEMYSANIVEEGTLKIAYLGKATDEEEVLFTFNFDATTDELSEDAISIEGSAYNTDGEELTIGIKEVEKETEDSKDPEEPTDPEGPTDSEDPKEPEQPGDSADTSDNGYIGFYTVLAGLALVCIIVMKRFTKQTNK